MVKRVEFIWSIAMFSLRQILNILPDSTSKQKAKKKNNNDTHSVMRKCVLPEHLWLRLTTT